MRGCLVEPSNEEHRLCEAEWFICVNMLHVRLYKWLPAPSCEGRGLKECNGTVGRIIRMIIPLNNRREITKSRDQHKCPTRQTKNNYMAARERSARAAIYLFVSSVVNLCR